MQEIIKKGRDFRIIPENFESATIFELKNADNNNLEIELTKATPQELEDYKAGIKVEIFGSGGEGLIFFESTIKEQNGSRLLVEMPKHCKNIQRREYSRVRFIGEFDIEGQNDNVVSIEDISAGFSVPTLLKITPSGTRSSENFFKYPLIAPEHSKIRYSQSLSASISL